jgi:hypothetical protein
MSGKIERQEVRESDENRREATERLYEYTRIEGEARGKRRETICKRREARGER